MGESQTTSRETVRVLTALSDENRFRIVELLASEEEELSCGAIGKALDISPSLLSHHLAILADAEIIGRRKNGLWTMNVLQREVIERQVRTLQALIHSGTAPFRNGGPQDGPSRNGHVDGLVRLHTAAEQGAAAGDATVAPDSPALEDEAVSGP